ncbi:hypothetical protein HU200_046407 [Digitaria exilis]|uniref:Peptidase S8/S53 domain-containing protein n=1 Tax=Digitaria exilis TaxID=1010633 RepID=A0A835EB61_9POAL|nr:hypothetical protein HU200_046407 [Digitaria exilis]
MPSEHEGFSAAVEASHHDLLDQVLDDGRLRHVAGLPVLLRRRHEPAAEPMEGACQNFTCNNKIIGARAYHNGATGMSPVDDHVLWEATRRPPSPASGCNVSLDAVPGAALAVYRVCWQRSHCADVDILAAFDDAIADGVNVISMSIGSLDPSPYFEDAAAIVKRGAHLRWRRETPASTVGMSANVAPWMLSVAASSTDRQLVDKIVLGNGKTIVVRGRLRCWSQLGRCCRSRHSWGPARRRTRMTTEPQAPNPASFSSPGPNLINPWDLEVAAYVKSFHQDWSPAMIINELKVGAGQLNPAKARDPRLDGLDDLYYIPRPPTRMRRCDARCQWVPKFGHARRSISGLSPRTKFGHGSHTAFHRGRPGGANVSFDGLARRRGARGGRARFARLAIYKVTTRHPAGFERCKPDGRRQYLLLHRRHVSDAVTIKSAGRPSARSTPNETRGASRRVRWQTMGIGGRVCKRRAGMLVGHRTDFVLGNGETIVNSARSKRSTLGGVRQGIVLVTYFLTSPSRCLSPVLAPESIGAGDRHHSLMVPYNIISGTSMACPHASGAAAYVKSFRRDWSPAMIIHSDEHSGQLQDHRVQVRRRQLNPVKANNPGVVYDALENDYGTMPRNFALITGSNTTICPDATSTTRPWRAHVEPGNNFTISFPRTLRNIIIAIETAKDIAIDVSPSRLEFSAPYQKDPVHRDGVHSAAIVWYNNEHEVRSPVVVYSSTRLADL